MDMDWLPNRNGLVAGSPNPLKRTIIRTVRIVGGYLFLQLFIYLLCYK